MINIRDIMGPTPFVPETEPGYEGIFEEVRTILRAWANLGTLDISNTVVFNLLTSWNVRNTGTAVGYAGLKVSIIETQALNPDQLWWQYTPLSREGGPGKVADRMNVETVGAIGATVWGLPIQAIEPTAALYTLTCNFEIPGPLVAAAADFWYNGHPAPTFKVGVEVLELASLAGAHVRSIDNRTLTEAFALRAQRMLVPALLAVGEPSIGWGLVL